MTHDYTRKGGIVHAEIMLPAHAPPEFADRSILWNSVEQIEKARDSQLAREIEAALPRELSGEQQLALVRAYVKDNFVDKGMCADFAIHDKGTGNPHVHIMLTLRPLKENGQWGAKCRKAYDLDENGQRIPDGKGGWKNHREDTTDWNDKGNVEIWRAAWAAYTNRALESAGRPERIDHRSYKRQGIDKIPSVHLGPAASQMEKRGIRTDKGEVNRQIAADNKLLKEIKARITRLYLWSKDEAEKPQTQQSSLTALWEAQQQLNAPRTRTGKIRALQESAALFSFLQTNGIQSMQQLHEKIADIHVRCLIDECANIGQIPNLEKLVATIRSREISACLVLQARSQLKAIYKDNADTIVGNMDSQIFLGGSEPTTLKDLSEMLGKETIDAFNTSDTRGNSPSYGTTFQKMGHELLSRDELAVLDGDKCILQLRGVRPFLSDKYDLTQHPNYKLTSDYDSKNTFDIEKYLNRKEKINPNDEFVVIDADSLPSA